MRRGFTIIELPIYTTILLFLMLAVVYSLLTIGRSYATLKAERAVQTSARSILERTVREIKAASTVEAGSVFNTHPGTLELRETDAQGGATTTRIYLSSNRVAVDRNGAFVGYLTPQSVTVRDLVFRRYLATSTLITIDLTLSGAYAKGSSTRSFDAGAVMRGEY